MWRTLNQIFISFFCIAILTVSIIFILGDIFEVPVQRLDLSALSQEEERDLVNSFSETEQHKFDDFFRAHESLETISSTYVLAASLINHETTKPLVASLNYPNLDYGRFTLWSKDSVNYSKVFGDEVPFSSREKFFRLPVYEMQLKTQSDMLTIQVIDTVSNQLQLAIYEENHFEKYSQYNLFLYGLYFGLLLLLIGGSLFLLFFTREVSFLWYSIYISCSVVFLLSANGLGQAFLWNEQSFTTRYSFWAAAGMALFITQFAMSFVNDVNKSLWFLFVSSLNLSVLGVICILLIFFHHGIFDSYFFFFAFLQMGAVLGFAIQAYLQKQKDALFLIFGYLALFPSLILSILKFSGILESSPITNHSLEVALLFEAIIFSTGLGFKLRRLRRAESEMIRAQENYLNNLITVREHEKRDMAIYLHNSVAQLLALLKRKLMGLEATTSSSAISEASGLADQAMHKLREISRDTYPHLLKDIGLAKTIEQYAGRHLELVDVDFKSAIDDMNFDDRRTLLLYRILQECINNVVRHANASRVNLKLKCQGGRCQLQFSDDGDGFDVRVSGFGLATIREYTQALGGELEIQSALKVGTTIAIEF